MKKRLLCFFSVLALLWFQQLISQNDSRQQSYLQYFEKAEKLFNGSATDSTDSIAIICYNKVINEIKPSPAVANLLYSCHEKSGILKQGLNYSYKDVLNDFYAALFLKQQYYLNDSIAFRLMLATGNILYTNGMFDSSIFYFNKAEKIIDAYPSAGLAGDLYNSIGALYSEAGNYAQSGVYFNKALELTKQTRPDLHDAIFAMSANVASAVKLSGYLDSALYLYKKNFDSKKSSLPIINNIAGIYLSKKQPDSALNFLQLSLQLNGNYGITFHNIMAQAYMQKPDTVNAAMQLNEAAKIYTSNPSHLKNNNYAATCKYFGDLMLMENKPQQALLFYQQSLIQYDFSFNDENVFANPGNFIGEFTSYNLFDALAAKANCFAKIFYKNKDVKYFKAAQSAYDSAFALSDYIKKSIDNDEARLFIADKVFNTYIKAVDFLLSAENNNDAIIHALEWISKSRATSLAISLKENQVKQYAGLPDSLLQQEKNIKINISRLKLQLQQSADSTEQRNLVSSINTYSLQLQTLNNTFKSYPDYYRQKFEADNINISAIQKNILNSNTAALCYFKGDSVIHAFIIKQKNITAYVLKTDSLINNNRTAFIENLSQNSSGKYYDNSHAKYLYNVYIQPLLNDLSDVHSLIILPDQELINIPFEAFQSNDNKFLIEDYAITYQYALPFLQKNKSSFSKDKAIAFAPFTNSNNQSSFQELPSSTEEISGFPVSAQFINNMATKTKFLSASVNAGVIHLATHAAVNFQQPEDSYIAFYPFDKTDSSYKIYAHELYNLQLPKTQLVFLSACETGSGKVSQSEGALSLSRAFAFAGCPNIVTSLWKAEDKTTAYISERFYKYAGKGFSYAEALQKAKIDLLNDEAMSQYHSPQYWSHLIFIGNVQDEKISNRLWYVVTGIIAIALIIFMSKRKRINAVNNLIH